MIILVTGQNELVDTLSSTIPSTSHFEHFQNTSALKPCLTHWHRHGTDLLLILVDADIEVESVSTCYKLCQSLSIDFFSIIALTSQPHKRENLLKSGADDYLLLPLIETEVQAKLTLYTHVAEVQIDAAKNAFIALIARTLSQHPDLNAALTAALKLIVPLLNGNKGTVWLFDQGETHLELVSVLDNQFSPSQMAKRPSDKGLIGWLVAQTDVQWIRNPQTHPAYTRKVDDDKQESNQLLSAPLHHQGKTLGVLVIHKTDQTTFKHQDQAFLASVASQIAPAIAHLGAFEKLRDQAQRQQTLYEMSQQIATGLDLTTTLNRAVYWLSHIAQAEIGLLWLNENNKSNESNEEKTQSNQDWRLVATFGTNMPSNTALTLASPQGLISKVGRQRNPVVIHYPSQDSDVDESLLSLANDEVRDTIVVPIIYQRHSIGVIALFNKQSTPFAVSDLTFICTAAEMVAIGIENARMHTQTVSLIQERARLQRQLSENERLSTIGRLTASLCHEINNPMQAIQGALALAEEELHDPTEVEIYLNLCLQESTRVVELINRLGQIYRPQSSSPQTLHLNPLLQDVISFAGKELNRQQVKPVLDLQAELQPVTLVANQVYLVCINLLLNIGEAIGATGGKQLWVRSWGNMQSIGVDFLSTPTPLRPDTWRPFLASDISVKDTEFCFGLTMSQEIMTTHQGTIQICQHDTLTQYRVEFPLSDRLDINLFLDT
ncbi:MAG: GAF domain-containing protein [Chloroflexota bacterium]